MAKEKKEIKNSKEVKNSKDKTSFMKSFKAELKKVIWPSPKQLFNNTVEVLVIVIIKAIIVFALDFVFESMNKYGIDKIKEVVSNSANANENVNNEESTDTESENTENVTTDSNVDNEETNETTEEPTVE